MAVCRATVQAILTFYSKPLPALLTGVEPDSETFLQVPQDCVKLK